MKKIKEKQYYNTLELAEQKNISLALFESNNQKLEKIEAEINSLNEQKKDELVKLNDLTEKAEINVINKSNAKLNRQIEKCTYQANIIKRNQRLVSKQLDQIENQTLEKKSKLKTFLDTYENNRYDKVNLKRYYDENKLPLKLLKARQKISDNETLIEDLTNKVAQLMAVVPDKNDDDKVSKKVQKNLEKSIKLLNKIEKTKIINLHLTQKLELINNGKLENYSLVQRVKNLFVKIPYKFQKRIWGVLFTTPWLIGMALFFIPSFVDAIIWSFNAVDPKNGLALEFVGFQNYIDLFTKYVIDGNIVFSVQLYDFLTNLVVDLPIILIFSILIATLLNKEFKGHKIIKAIFFIPVIFNVTLISDTLSKGFGQYIDSATNADQMFVTMLTNFFLEIGLGNSIMEIVLQAVDRIFTIVNLSGIQILIFIAAIQSIPNQLYEAAKMEGASKYEIFWKITIAMITPMILTAAVYTVVDSFTRAPIYKFLDYAMTQSRYGLAAAISISYFLINIVILGVVYLLMKGKVFYYDDKK